MPKRVNKGNNVSIDTAKRNLNFDETDGGTPRPHTKSGNYDSSAPNSQVRTSGMQRSLPKHRSNAGANFLIVLIILISLIVLVSWWPFSIVEKNGSLHLHWSERSHIYLWGLLVAVMTSFCLSAGCLWLTWTVTYHDSLQPGRVPPTPASPAKYRRESGHTFHMNYSMGLLNAAALFCYLIYYSADTYISH